MTTLPNIPLLIPSLLLVFTTSAAAECAWVLWARPSIVDQMMPDGSIRTTPRGEWQIGTAFATQSECNGTAITQYQLTLKARKGPMSVGDTLNTFDCFP